MHPAEKLNGYSLKNKTIDRKGDCDQMSENEKIIRGKYNGSRFFTTDPAYQHDTGHLLQLIGFDLPEKYDLHFAHSVEDEATVVRDCSGDTFKVPDELFTEARTILCWICFRSETEFFTLYEGHIPILSRPQIPRP